MKLCLGLNVEGCSSILFYSVHAKKKQLLSQVLKKSTQDQTVVSHTSITNNCVAIILQQHLEVS